MSTYIKYGVVFGIGSAMLCILYFYLTLLWGINPLGGSKAFGYFLMLIVFFLLLWHFRTSEKAGILHFHQGVFLVMVEHIITCLVFSFFIWISLKYFHPDLLNRHILESQKFLHFIKPDLIKTIGEEKFVENLNNLDLMTPFSVAKDEFIKRFFTLSFFALIASFIMRRSPYWSVSK